jgi:glycosyltransferase involved in cell wall biosynthesis
MKVAIFDYRTTSQNAIGKCTLGVLQALCDQHECTVFAVEFDNPRPDRIDWVRVPALRSPLVLLFITFHLMAPLCYFWHRIRRGARFDLVQIVESNLSFGDIVYSHSCHRMFLERYWAQVEATGLRGVLRWLDHWMHALLEPWVYRRASYIVVPSEGFARELRSTYSHACSKIRVLPNAVDPESMRAPEQFDRGSFRAQLGFTLQDVVLIFVALGHFELKGLRVLLEAVSRNPDGRLKVLVVGGSRSLINEYRQRAVLLGLNGKVVFSGVQKDIRAYLWAADALVLPSLHETFSLVTLEAAAAGLPVLVTKLNGVEDFLRDGENGLLLQRDVSSVSHCLARFAQIPQETRREMGSKAQASVQRYNLSEFVLNWSKLYAEVQAHVR